MNCYCNNDCLTNYRTSGMAEKRGLSKNTLLLLLFFSFNLLSFIQAYVANIHCAVFACAIIIAYYFLFPKCFSFIKQPLFIAYFLIQVLSSVAYAFNGRPFDLFITCITYNLLPMLMFGIGAYCNGKESESVLNKGVLFSNSLIIIFTLIVYIFPSASRFFGEINMNDAGFVNEVGYRLSSHFDSLELGNICAIGIVFIFMVRTKHRFTKLFLLILTVGALFLTMQRGAWVIGALAIVFSLVIDTIKRKKRISSLMVKILLFGIIGLLTIYVASNYFMSDTFSRYLNMRITQFNLEEMFGSRHYQVVNGIETFLSHPFGFGMGSAGIKAAKYDLQIVPDNNLLKILVETGFFGFLSFISLNILALYRGIKHKKYFSTLIIIFYLIQSMGSNVIDYYYTSFIYWMMLGYLCYSKGVEKLG